MHVYVPKFKSWWDIGFEGNGGVKSKETRVCNSKGNVIVLYLACL